MDWLFYHCKNIISCGSKIQQIIALSPAEAEYVASATCVAEIIYLKGLPKDLNYKTDTVLLVVNQSALSMIKTMEIQ